jgi:hypothetical protein
MTGKFLAKANLSPFILPPAALILGGFSHFLAPPGDYPHHGERTGLPGPNGLIPVIAQGIEVSS